LQTYQQFQMYTTFNPISYRFSKNSNFAQTYPALSCICWRDKFAEN